MTKTIGFIGYKGHALRLLKIFSGLEGWKVSYVFHPQKDIDVKQIGADLPSDVKTTRHFKDLLACDAVVIASPNLTHFSYLKELAASYRGYVFCEKPPVSSAEELEQLKDFPADFKKRLYFNFNMRSSWLYEQLKTLPQRFDLGEPVRASVIVGYGFAFKEAYLSSWRSKKEFHPSGVLETLGIHYLDLLSGILGRPDHPTCYVQKHSPNGEAMDTCHLTCILGGKCVLHLSCSYAIPFSNRVELHYTNGYIEFDNGDLNVFAPRDTFDAKGSFVRPPVKHHVSRQKEDLYLESLINSCRLFADHIVHGRHIDAEHFQQSVLSNQICLSVHETLISIK